MKKQIAFNDTHKTIILIGLFALAIAFVIVYFNLEIERVEEKKTLEKTTKTYLVH